MTQRIVVPGFPHHVVSRGHYRQPVFIFDGDYEAYLADLIELKRELDVQVHAYCLMTNHVHLLMTPATETGLGAVMQRLNGRHTIRRNRRDDLVGTLWQGRYGSSVVDTERYLMVVCRYIELNPVRAGMVGDATAYRWSSCAARLNGGLPAWLDPDPCYLAMGDTPEGRREAYREFLLDGSSDRSHELVRDAIRRGQLTGDPDFSEKLATQIGRVVERRGPGRPRKLTEK